MQSQREGRTQFVTDRWSFPDIGHLVNNFQCLVMSWVTWILCVWGPFGLTGRAPTYLAISLFEEIQLPFLPHFAEPELSKTNQCCSWEFRLSRPFFPAETVSTPRDGNNCFHSALCSSDPIDSSSTRISV